MFEPKRPRKPLLIDSSIETAFMIKYWIYALFGILGVIVGTPTLAEFGGIGVARVISGVIAAASITAAIAVPRAFGSSFWTKVELYATITVVSFVGMYAVFAAILALGGDDRRVSLAMIASALVVFPLWRISQIIKDLRRGDKV